MATFKAISRRQTPSSSYGKDDMITLLVGEDEEEMFAYGSYLSLYSGFFKAALKKEWAEGQTRTVKLPEEDPETVTFYFDFLDGKGLPPTLPKAKVTANRTVSWPSYAPLEKDGWTPRYRMRLSRRSSGLRRKANAITQTIQPSTLPTNPPLPRHLLDACW
jgi:hypothetical protein